MRSGGTVTWEPSRIPQTDYKNDSSLDPEDIEKGRVITDPNESPDYVGFQGKRYKWDELKQAIGDAAKQHGAAKFGSGQNISPEDVRAQINKLGIRPVSDTAELDQEVVKLQTARRTLQAADANLTSAAKGKAKTDAQKARDAAFAKVGELETALRNAVIQARNRGVSDRQLNVYAATLGDPAREDGSSGNGNGAGGARFMVNSQPGPSGGQAAQSGQGAQNGQNGQGARAMGLPGTGAGGYGFPFGGGMEAPNSAAYASALYMDGAISDGLGNIGKSQREGQKLMLLFFYYARMAESGDIGAMYQLIKFVNYVIAKDKARQNIQITSKLIQLQDLSRKSTEALMSVATDDPEKQADFTKALHKAKSEEQTIATSQKLLADMLQEFAQVVESLTNSTKFLLEAEGRIMRTVTRP